MQTADMTLKLDYGCSFFNSIRQTMQYSQRYGLEEHSHILDVDFAVSEARYKLLQQALVIYLNVEQRAHWLPIQERTNQLCHVVMSLGQIELDLSDCAI